MNSNLNSQQAKSVLIVEDSFMVAWHLELAISQLGFLVTEICDSAETAIAAAARTIPDLVLMDITLKGKMDGIKCASYLRELYNVPVIYISALTDRDTIHRAEESNPFGYISKPFDDAVIGELICRAMERAV